MVRGADRRAGVAANRLLAPLGVAGVPDDPPGPGPGPGPLLCPVLMSRWSGADQSHSVWRRHSHAASLTRPHASARANQVGSHPRHYGDGKTHAGRSTVACRLLARRSDARHKGKDTHTALRHSWSRRLRWRRGPHRSDIGSGSPSCELSCGAGALRAARGALRPGLRRHARRAGRLAPQHSSLRSSLARYLDRQTEAARRDRAAAQTRSPAPTNRRRRAGHQALCAAQRSLGPGAVEGSMGASGRALGEAHQKRCCVGVVAPPRAPRHSSAVQPILGLGWL